MYKNQLQELAQRSCFNLPSYACIREGPDHAPRFKASVNFNGEIFEGPSNCTTLRQAEHAAAEVALHNLSTRGPSRTLTARVLDETGVYKNLLQETAHRAGLKLPVYTTVRSGPGHQPVFTCNVELAGMSFNGEPAKTKKQAEKNAAMAAWSALKQMPNLEYLSRQAKEIESSEEQEQVVVARVLSSFRPKEESSRAQGHREQLLQRRASGSSNSSFWYRKHRWSMDPLVEASSPSTPMHQAQKQSYLTGSKILLTMPTNASSPETPSSKEKTSISPGFHSSSRYLPVEIRSSSQAPLENHRMDEYNSKATPLAPHCRAFPLQTQINTKPFSPIPHPHPTAGAGTMPAMPRRISAGGYHAAPGLAPMVHIRTVIPVCATPPMRLPASNATVHKKDQDDEVSAATSKLTNLQL
ncbi:putative double-stranded RNA-binding domain-containing protein [Dioscorea sansibarensis]